MGTTEYESLVTSRLKTSAMMMFRMSPVLCMSLCLVGALVLLLFVYRNDVILHPIPSKVNAAFKDARNWGLTMVQQPKDAHDVTFSMEEILKGPPEQDDARVLQYIRQHHLFPPSTNDYNLSQAGIVDTSMGQASQVREILGDMRNGFFVECGALDGETRSNTLVLEKLLGWQGLLVEGDPKNFDLLLKKRRHVWSSNACLATKPYPQKVMFEQAFNLGKISSQNVDKEYAGSKYTPVQCFPLYSLMRALNRTTIDYFSLDVEGNELDVLRTIPFDKITIKVMSVEYIHDKEGREVLQRHLEDNGFRLYSEVRNRNGLANDVIMVHKSVSPPGGFPDRVIEVLT